MNYVVLCENAKSAYNLFYETLKCLTPINVNMKTKKIIYAGDVYSFESRDFFERYLKESFQGEAIDHDYFYYITDELPFH